MNLESYIIIFLLLILFILLIPVIKKYVTREPMMVYSIGIGETMDGINKHLYSPNKKMRLIFDNGLRIQEVDFSDQIPQTTSGIQDSGYYETHLKGTDKRLINRLARSLTFDNNGLTLYDKTLNEEHLDDDDDPVIQVESERNPIKITNARFSFNGFTLRLKNNGDLVARNAANQDYTIISLSENKLITPR